MTSTETTRYTVERIDGQWTVIRTDETGRQGVGTYQSRAAARAARDERSAVAELVPLPEDHPANANVERVIDEGGWEYPQPEGTPAERSEGGPAPEQTPEPEQTPKPEAPAEPTGQSEVARKLQQGQRIVLRGVGTVTVTGVSKVRGQQKVLVTYQDEQGADGERELWVNSKYRLVA